MTAVNRMNLGARAMLAIMAAVAVFAVAAAFAASASAQTSEITAEDCEAGRITRNGEAISESECRALIGQRVDLADTGFEAWMLMAAGGALMAGAAGFVLVRRRSAGGALGA